MDKITEQISAILKNGNIENFRREAQWIADESDSPEEALLRASKRAQGVPLQYLLGTAPFRNLMLKVDPRVLIPRPETELLAQWIIENAPENGSVLDLGCGSGAIAIAVATERRDLHVTAADISPDALTLAKENAADNHADIEFIHSDLFSALNGKQFHIIGANLPYVTEEEYPSLDREVRDFEPKLALTAPNHGMALIEKTIASLAEHLLPRGKAIFELAPEQAQVIAQIARNTGFDSEIIRDLCQRDRFVTAKLP